MNDGILSISSDTATADVPASGAAETQPNGGEQNQQASISAPAQAGTDAPQVDPQQPTNPLNNVLPISGRPSDVPTNPIPGQPVPQNDQGQPPPEELTPEAIAELAKVQPGDTNTLKSVRQALARSNDRFSSLQTEIETLKTRPDIPPERMEQYNAARDFQVKFTQIPIDPDEAMKFANERLAEMHDLNPLVTEQMEQINFWKFAFTPEGTPNKDHFQMIIDSMGLPNAVKVDDVFNAIDALANGRLGAEDLDYNLSEAEKAFRQKTQAFEEQNKAQQDRWQTEMDSRETEVRTNATQSIVQNISQQFQTGIKSHLDTLNLMPKADDTPDVREYKDLVLANISSYVAQLEGQNADFQYIRQRVDTLKKPQRVDSERARLQVEQVGNSLDFQERLNRGLRDINDKVREYANKQAKNYSRWLRGGDDPQVATVVNGARVEPGSTNWKAPQSNGAPVRSGMSVVDAGAEALANARRQAGAIG